MDSLAIEAGVILKILERRLLPSQIHTNALLLLLLLLVVPLYPAGSVCC